MQMTFIMQMHANQVRPSENQGWEREKKLDTKIEWKKKGIREQSFWVAGGCKLGKRSVNNIRGCFVLPVTSSFFISFLTPCFAFLKDKSVFMYLVSRAFPVQKNYVT